MKIILTWVNLVLYRIQFLLNLFNIIESSRLAYCKEAKPEEKVYFSVLHEIIKQKFE
jgi:hypothetical protein